MNRHEALATPKAADRGETCLTHGRVALNTAPPLKVREEKAARPLRIKLPASAHPLEQFLSGLQDSVLLTDREGYIVSANPSAEARRLSRPLNLVCNPAPRTPSWWWMTST
ncbi:MAG: hypothetical protein ABR497_03040 [Kiritimatiellia bacterium]|nr:hypothetical protein [Lentisphaerota bacterium]